MEPEWKLSAHGRPLVACVCVCCFWWQRSSPGPPQPLKAVGAQVFSAALTCPAVQSPGLSAPAADHIWKLRAAAANTRPGPPDCLHPSPKLSPLQEAKKNCIANHVKAAFSVFFFFLSGSVGSFRSQDLCNTEGIVVSADPALIRVSGSVQGR